jgi:hypothetical protein
MPPELINPPAIGEVAGGQQDSSLGPAIPSGSDGFDFSSGSDYFGPWTSTGGNTAVGAAQGKFYTDF